MYPTRHQVERRAVLLFPVLNLKGTGKVNLEGKGRLVSKKTSFSLRFCSSFIRRAACLISRYRPNPAIATGFYVHFRSQISKFLPLWKERDI